VSDQTTDAALPGAVNPSGSLDDLTALRVKRDNLAAAATNLLAYEDTYEIGKDVRDRAVALAAVDFDVLVPCLLCTSSEPVTVQVGSDSMPRAVVCAACDSEVERSVMRALHDQD
jgi:hypothetical protein